MKNLLFALSFCVNLFAQVDISLSHNNIVHGSSFAVMVKSNEKLEFAPNVKFMNKTYQMFTVNGSTKNYELFLPISYHAKKQKENVQVVYIVNKQIIKQNINIEVISGTYKQNEILKLKKAKVKLSKKNKKKANSEYDTVYKNVYSVINSTNYISNSKFSNPMDSIITSPYGTSRVINKTVQSFHSGTDFRAKVNTEVYASNHGRVALIMDRFYLGKVIYIDHGRSLYSYYAHMNHASVIKDQIVKKGELLGYSGKSGRITGPHLHYAFRLYNVTVDPMQFSTLHNKLLSSKK